MRFRHEGELDWKSLSAWPRNLDVFFRVMESHCKALRRV